MQISLVHRDMDDFDASAFASPEEKEMLHSIAKLNLSHNFLTTVRGVHSLSNLTELDISHNKVTTLAMIPLKVRRLHASYNNLQGIEGLTPLVQLEYCDVSYNEIRSIAAAGTFPNTLAMRHLDVSHNRLSSLEGVDAVPGLHVLHANHNLIREVVPCLDPVLRNLKSLRTLSLNENPVTARGKNLDAIQRLLPKLSTLDGIPVAHQQQLAIAAANTNDSGGGNRSVNQSGLSSDLSAARPSSRDRGQGQGASRLSETTTSMNPPSTNSRKAASPGKQRHTVVNRSPRSSSLTNTSLPSRPASPAGKPSLRPASPADRSRIGGQAVPRPSQGSVSREASPVNTPRSNSTNDTSVNAVAAQRRMEKRIEELERIVADYASRYKQSQQENEGLKMQLEQQREIVARQGKFNARMTETHTQEEARQRLRDTTSVGTVPAPRVGWTGGQSQQKPSSSSGVRQTGGAGPRRSGSVESTSGSRSGSAQRTTRAAAPAGSISPKNQDRVQRPVRSSGSSGAVSQYFKQVANSSQQQPSSSRRNGSAPRVGSYSGSSGGPTSGGGSSVRPSSAGSRGGASSTTRSQQQATAAMTPHHQSGHPPSRTPQSIVRGSGGGSSSSSARRPQSADARLKSILSELANDSNQHHQSYVSSRDKANLSVASSRGSGRNVSFGGSQFYSPPHIR